MLTFFTPTMRFSRSISRMPSTIKKGYRCGRYFWISTTSMIIRGLPTPSGLPGSPPKLSLYRSRRGSQRADCALLSVKLPAPGALFPQGICQRRDGLLASAAMTLPVDPKLLLKHLRAKRPAMLETLRELVGCESPSTEKAAVDRCAALVAEIWKRTGVRAEMLEQKHRG